MHSVVLGADGMTIEEAIEVIKKANVYSVEAIEELKSIEDKAIVLDKYGEYYSVLQNCLREIEACELAIVALEKQISKKATDIRYFGRFGRAGYYIGLCPCCKSGNNSEYQYCGVCGQAIDWSGENVN